MQSDGRSGHLDSGRGGGAFAGAHVSGSSTEGPLTEEGKRGKGRNEGSNIYISSSAAVGSALSAWQGWACTPGVFTLPHSRKGPSLFVSIVASSVRFLTLLSRVAGQSTRPQSRTTRRIFKDNVEYRNKALAAWRHGGMPSHDASETCTGVQRS